jgi:hypothetical protein
MNIFTKIYMILVTALSLAACGGGGDGGTSGGTTTPPHVAPTGTVSSYFPINGKTGVLKTINPVIVLNVANATSGDASAVAWKCNGTTINAVATAPVGNNPDGSTSMIVTFTPKAAADSANIHGGDYCTLNGDVSVIGAGGVAKVTVSMSFYIAPDVVCTAPQVLSADGQSCVALPVAWWPPTFVPMGTEMYLDSSKTPVGAVVNATYPGQTQSGLLPPECKTTGDACWQEAVRNGTIKFTATNATDKSGKAVVFGFYKTVSTISYPGQNKMVYCNRQFYADKGTNATNTEAPDAVENHCTLDEEVSFVSNSLGGVGSYIQNGVNVCAQKKFDQTLNSWIEVQVTCH